MKWSRGFTLIEAVLSLGVITFGLLGVMYAFGSMASNSVLADQTVIASNIARGSLERVQSLRDTFGYSTARYYLITFNYFNQTPVQNFPAYNLTVTAPEVDPDEDANVTDDFLDPLSGSGVARVTATVTWNGGKNTLSLVTIIADY